MAPVATNESQAPVANNGPVKAVKKAAEPLFNPFYSPTVASDKDDSDYKYAKYKVRTTAAAVVATPPCFLSIRAMPAML